MRLHPGLLVAVLVYVTLDFSLPAVPGAFVFEPAASVESVQAHRGRAEVEVAVRPADARPLSFVVLPSVDVAARLSPARERALVLRPVVSPLPRAAVDPASPSEDPH